MSLFRPADVCFLCYLRVHVLQRRRQASAVTAATRLDGHEAHQQTRATVLETSQRYKSVDETEGGRIVQSQSFRFSSV